MSSSSVHSASYLRQRKQREEKQEQSAADKWHTGHRARARRLRLSARARPLSQPCRPLWACVTSESERVRGQPLAAKAFDTVPHTHTLATVNKPALPKAALVRESGSSRSTICGE
jgi:hypothetical protein